MQFEFAEHPLLKPTSRHCTPLFRLAVFLKLDSVNCIKS